MQVRSNLYLQSCEGVVDLNETLGEGCGPVQKENNSWSEFCKQPVPSIDTKYYLTKAKEVLLRPGPSRLKQEAHPLYVVPPVEPSRLLRLTSLPLPLWPLSLLPNFDARRLPKRRFWVNSR